MPRGAKTTRLAGDQWRTTYSPLLQAVDTMAQKRPCVLSIAGFDPSGGAGVLADIKTFEMHRLIGLGVTTGITYQHESRFDGVDWLPWDSIAAQLDVLLERYTISAAKIGLTGTTDVLSKAIGRLREVNPQMHIVWDPVMSASAGFRFHSGIDGTTLEHIARSLSVITPNWTEMLELVPGDWTATEAASRLGAWCAVLLKGGHNDAARGYDYLVTSEWTRSYRPKTTAVHAKHGSGCVLSAALTSALAEGFPLHRACLRAKRYTTRFLESTPGLLGFHKR